jgi:hypothetical protein
MRSSKQTRDDLKAADQEEPTTEERGKFAADVPALPVSKQPSQQALRELYPSLDETHLQEAEENLTRYVALALRIYERIQADPEALKRFRLLTGAAPPDTMPTKGRVLPP